MGNRAKKHSYPRAVERVVEAEARLVSEREKASRTGRAAKRMCHLIDWMRVRHGGPITDTRTAIEWALPIFSTLFEQFQFDDAYESRSEAITAAANETRRLLPGLPEINLQYYCDWPPRWMTTRDAGNAVKLPHSERQRLKITSMRPFDLTDAQFERWQNLRNKARNRERKSEARREQGIRTIEERRKGERQKKARILALVEASGKSERTVRRWVADPSKCPNRFRREVYILASDATLTSGHVEGQARSSAPDPTPANRASDGILTADRILAVLSQLTSSLSSHQIENLVAATRHGTDAYARNGDRAKPRKASQ